MSIYVESFMRVPLDSLWSHTQDPDLHQRWDLRFTRIEYLPRPDPDAPQRFLYATRIGLGLAIRGEGESVATRDGEHGERTSSLKFGSDDPKSLIREGSGYWKYVPAREGIRFLTWYDYHTRFGMAGRLLDRLLFRPIMGWATAWSFDRLRLWLERGLDPTASLRRWLSHGVARCALAFTFAWHGLVPKLIFRHPDESLVLTDGGISERLAGQIVTAAGVIEIGVAFLLLIAWRRAWPVVLVVVLMAAALAGVAFTSPRYLTAAFNPVTLNLGVIALAIVVLLNRKDLPSASRCLRAAPAEPQ